MLQGSTQAFFPLNFPPGTLHLPLLYGDLGVCLGDRMLHNRVDPINAMIGADNG